MVVGSVISITVTEGRDALRIFETLSWDVPFCGNSIDKRFVLSYYYTVLVCKSKLVSIGITIWRALEVGA